MTKLLFVYGTLKSGHFRSDLMKNQKLRGEFQTEKGYTIYNCGHFPGIVKTETDSYVTGEIWEVDEEYFSYLDRIEGSPFLFKLQPIKIKGASYEVSAYFWQKSTEGLVECGPTWTADKEI